ncbi:putative E3 ubiquitin-protein ligase HERC3 [Sarcoptes scabiei]|nr:putative E3 ubiquitin-protein ligase HERC3 [Sarcoptes scabiei]
MGLGTIGNYLSTPTLIEILQWTPIRQIAAGGYHSAILSSTGAIYLWGKNEFGQLGLSDEVNRTVPCLQKSLRNQKIVHINLGEEHSAALTQEGGLFTWGAGMYGQLGHGKNSNEILPRKVFELMGICLIQVSCGRCHTLAVSKIGRVYSFGLNGSGQLGIGNKETKLLPVNVRGPWSEINTKDVIVREEQSMQLINSIPNDNQINRSVPVVRNINHINPIKQDSFDMEIDEISESNDNNENDPQEIIIEEPEEQEKINNRRPSTTRRPQFVCDDDTVFERKHALEIDEYESDPDSECDECPIKSQYIIKEIISSLGDQSFVILQMFDNKVLPKDLRKNIANNEIMKLQNNIFEQMKFVATETTVPLDLIDYIENVFASVPAINSSYLTSINYESDANLMTKIQNFQSQNPDEFNRNESIDINFDDHINWQQAFHGFNMIEDAQNDRINDLIYQNLLKVLKNMPDTVRSFRDHKVRFDGEVMRIYQLLPLFHLFRMTSYSEQSQNLISSFARSILKLDPHGLGCLKMFWCKMHRRFFRNLIEIFKSCIKINLAERVKELEHKNDQDKSVHMNVALSLDMLKQLYSVNKMFEKVSYKEFYIQDISDLFDLKFDYIAWKNQRFQNYSKVKNYFLCDYPFIFDAPAKNIILATDSDMQQSRAAESTVRAQIIMQIASASQSEIHIDPYFTIYVHRDTLLQDTVQQLCFHHVKSSEFKKPLRVYFEGEEAVDAGQGMKKEFFILIMKQILDQQYGMFVEFKETNTIWFNHAMNEDDEIFFKTIGILCGLAIYNKVIIDLPFPLILYKKILNENLELKDLAQLDPILEKNLGEIVNPTFGREEFDAIFGEINFTITLDTFGTPVEYELCTGGKSKILKYDNRAEYVELYWKFMLIESVRKQFDSFLKGFSMVLDTDILEIFQAEELMQLVEGEDVIEWEELEILPTTKNRSQKTIQRFDRSGRFFSISPQNRKRNF